MQYGYNIWVINFPAVIMLDFYNGTTTDENVVDVHQHLLWVLMMIAIALFPFGGFVGTFLLGPLMDKCGRKRTLLLSNVLSLISSVILGCSKLVDAHEFSMFSRFVAGICSGMFSSAVPICLAEISPKYLRGAINTVAILFLTLGIQLGQIFALEEVLGNTKGFPILMSFSMILALFDIFLLPLFPESPRYLLIQKRNEEQAREVLKKLRGQVDVEDEIEELRLEDTAERAEKNMNIFKLLCLRSLRWKLLSIFILMIGQQFADINAAYLYAEKIYLAMGVQEHMFPYVGAGLATIFLVVNMVTIYFIDSLGRRTLLLAGLSICCACAVVLSVSIKLQETLTWLSYINAGLVITFVAAHITGPTTVPNLLTTEFFLQSSRVSGVIFAGSVYWICKFIIGLTYITIRKKVGPYGFLVFLPIPFVALVYSYKYIPETKNKTFLDIRRLMAVHVPKKILARKQTNS
ncbi:solute carrier family 2, facilitated glucose transporter member 5-like isoform X2 [Hemicordylus capensis]|nr:solute carrier family 2, facilitated glucose transporter member 5-like isoform X2 [Hemicordylus capensis]XP_053136757.1 solute carrier family 2, facilitated glucose transporter member 5-like isoform X2 [Hemicordylus capensis]